MHLQHSNLHCHLLQHGKELQLLCQKHKQDRNSEPAPAHDFKVMQGCCPELGRDAHEYVVPRSMPTGVASAISSRRNCFYRCQHLAC